MRARLGATFWAGIWLVGLMRLMQPMAQPVPIESGGLGDPVWETGEAVEWPSPVRRQDAAPQRYDHGDPSGFEQFMLEWVNQARANPGAEAVRLGIGLNEGLEPGTIVDTPKPPLAFNPNLIAASRAHSGWMLDTDTFDHIGVNGSNPGDRMEAAGYVFSGSWTWGENVSWHGTTGTPNVEAFTAAMHDGLFKSPGHRRNLCNAGFDEVGIGILQGSFSTSEREWNAVMGTQKFARSASTPGPLLVGVVYYDANGNGQYDPGEGVPEVTVTSAAGDWYAVTSASGGYALPYGAGVQVTFSGGPLARAHTAELMDTGANVKLDLELGSVAYADFVQSSMRWTPDQGFQAEIEGTPGAVVVLEASEELRSWKPVTSVTLGSGRLAITDPAGLSGRVRFYRLRMAQ